MACLSGIESFTELIIVPVRSQPGSPIRPSHPDTVKNTAVEAIASSAGDSNTNDWG